MYYNEYIINLLFIIILLFILEYIIYYNEVKVFTIYGSQ